MRVRPTSPLLASMLLAAMAGCPKDPPPINAPEPAGPKSESAESVPSEPAPVGSGLSAPPKQVASEMAAAWCDSGGEQFRGPIATPDDEYPPALESCAEIEATVADSTERDETLASVIHLEALGFETREALLYQRGERAWVAWTMHTLEDESGEAGSYDRTLVSTQLRDVGGGPELEWVAVIREEEGDSFEADRCYERTVETQSLAICGPHEDGFACAEVAFSTRHASSPRPEEDLHDCDEDAEDLEDPSVSGFEMGYGFENGGIVFTAVADAAIDEVEEPPYAGPVPLEQLYEEAAIDIE